jgi:hypothetical protein
MKVCPRCQKTYTDENLNFCLEDGSVLTQASAAAPPATEQVLINQTRMAPPPNQSGAQAGWGSAPQQFSMQPPAKKGSKTWVWVVGILGLLVLVCGGGLVGFFAWVASQDSGRVYNTSSSPSPSPTATLTTTTTNSTSGRTSVQSIDMSRWVQDFSAGGNTEYTDNEFIISSKQKTYYYVLVARDTYAYDEADVSITVRNIDDASSEMGYGLIFHSDPTPLTQDYAFLIDTKKKRFRVVRHAPQKETSVVPWKNSPAIKGGTEANVLEARDDGDSVNLYINGEKVTTIKNTDGYSNGVPGVYSGNAVRAAFSKLEVRK